MRVINEVDFMPGNLFVELFDASKYREKVKTLNREQSLTLSGFIPEPIRTRVKINRSQVELLRRELNDFHPNFKSVTNYIFDNLLLSTISKTKGISFQPLLLVGSPGIGKTFYTNKLASILDLPKIDIDFSTATSTFVLSGTSSKWGNSSAGAICKMLMTEKVANGIVIIDEIDKAGGQSSGGDPINALLNLLEPHTAAHFSDEFLEVPMDASHLNYVATANDISNLPAPVLSRFTIFHVEKPSILEIQKITKLAYKDLIKELEISTVFPADLDKDVVMTLGELNDIRALRKLLTNALVHAVKDNRVYLKSEDIIDYDTHVPRQRMGFL